MRWIQRLRRTFAPSGLRRELAEEQEYHLSAKMAELRQTGVSAAEARRRARLAFGEPLGWREASQQVKTSPWLADLLADMRYAGRGLRRQPGFALAAILSLALGLGAATAVFSVVDGSLLRGEPFPKAQQLQYVWQLMPPRLQYLSQYNPWLRRDFLDLRTAVTAPGHSFQSLGAMAPAILNLTGQGRPRRLQAVAATADVFAALAAQPELGRVYTPAEDQPGRGQEVLLSDATWRSVFHADPGVVGRTIELNGMPYQVIGVMPPEFQFPNTAALPAVFAFPLHTEIWVPAALSPGPTIPYENNVLAVVGRLRDGASPEQARHDLAQFTASYEARNPRLRGFMNLALEPVATLDTQSIRRPLWLLMLAVGLVFLVACSNVAGLLLSRALMRQREFALRAALGAGGWRLARQLLAEALALSVLGGALGASVALAALQSMAALMQQALPQMGNAHLDWRVFGFGMAAVLLSAVMCGLGPIVTLRRRQGLAPALGTEKGSVTGGAPPRLRGGLVVGQMALALVLAVAAGLLTRSLARMLAAGGGFDPTAAATAQLSLPPQRYATPAQAADFFDAVQRKLLATPGIVAAGVGLVAPLNGASQGNPILVPGRPVDPAHIPMTNYSMVSAGFFAASGIAVLRGREFGGGDTAASEPVVVVNQALADRVFPGQSALGQHIRVPIDKLPKRIVGVVENPKHTRLDEPPAPEMFVPITQNPWPSMLDMALVVRARPSLGGNLPPGLQQRVAAAVHAVDADVPVARWTPLQDLVSLASAPARFALALMAAFAGLSLLLATVGLYGVVALIAGQRRRELGLRLALGATRGSLLGLVLRQGVTLAAGGLVLGWALALAASQLLRGYLFGVAALDPVTLLLAPLPLVAGALLASLLPAHRASKLDPLTALRQD